VKVFCRAGVGAGRLPPTLEPCISKARHRQKTFQPQGWRRCWPFTAGADFSRILDVGGAFGSTLAAVMRQHSHLSGVLLDLPQV